MSRSSRSRTEPADRGVAPVLGGALLLVLAVAVGGSVAVVAFDTVEDAERATEPPQAVLSLSASGDRLTFVHRGGDPIDVETLRLEVAVDGEPLNHQPPVPFFSAQGFYSGPTGAFNPATATDWRGGEEASFRIAGTNEPTLEPGSRVTVDVSVGDYEIASLTATVG